MRPAQAPPLHQGHDTGLDFRAQPRADGHLGEGMRQCHREIILRAYCAGCGGILERIP